MRRTRALAVLLVLCASSASLAQTKAPRRNVVLIVIDGLRWQEVFNGADSTLLNGEYGGVVNVFSLRHRFWRSTAEARRKALMPFLWDVIANQGQIYGNQAKGSVAQVTNEVKNSYPGYNEMLTGASDKRITTNEFGPNPNLTVYEWLNQRPAFAGKVAAFGTWDVFPAIFNRERAKFYLRAGWEVPFPEPSSPTQTLINELYATTTRIWSDMTLDALMAPVVREYVTMKRPRVLFLGFGETDQWGHEDRYDRVLEAAHAVDQMVAQLWSELQQMPQYRGNTTLVFTTDHGRGSGLRGWRDHDYTFPGSENVWIALVGPGVAPLGERSNVARVTLSQIAATVAAAVGEDFAGSMPGVAPAIITGPK